MKTAVSLDQSLFEATEALARRMKTSRSRVVALALAEFVQRQQNREMLAQINAAIEDVPDTEDRAVLEGMRRQQRRSVEHTW